MSQSNITKTAATLCITLFLSACNEQNPVEQEIPKFSQWLHKRVEGRITDSELNCMEMFSKDIQPAECNDYLNNIVDKSNRQEALLNPMTGETLADIELTKEHWLAPKFWDFYYRQALKWKAEQDKEDAELKALQEKSRKLGW